MIWLLLRFSYSITAINCSDTQPYQMICEEVENCKLDESVDLSCVVFHSTICSGPRKFIKHNISCRYCFQLPSTEIECEVLTDCNPSISLFPTQCRPLSYCMGSSIFEKRTKCMKSDKKLTTAFLLSLFLGAVGADRFYLGYYVSAVFKLITLGGFGIVYMIDLLLLLFGYLGPANGALFPERL